MSDSKKIEVGIGVKTKELKDGLNTAQNEIEKSSKKIQDGFSGAEKAADDLKDGLEGVKDGLKSVSGAAEKAGDSLSDLGNKDPFGPLEDKAKKATKNIDANFDRLGKSINNSIKSGLAGVAATIAATFSVGAITSFTTGVINSGAEIQRYSKLAGENAQEMQRLSYGVATAGISLEKFGDMSKDVLDRFGEVSTAEGEMMDFFTNIAPKVNLTAESFKNLSGPEVIQKYFNALRDTNQTHAETTRYMEQLVSEGALLVPMLENNGAGFKYWGDKAQEANAVMSDEMLDTLTKAGANIRILGIHFDGLKATLVNAVTPAVQLIAKNFDNILAIAAALSAMLLTRLVVSLGATTAAFVTSTAQAIGMQIGLAGLQAQAAGTAVTMGVLRGAMAFLGGPVGLAVLAIQALAAGAAFLVVKNRSKEAASGLDLQSNSVTNLVEKYKQLDSAAQRQAVRDATDKLKESTEEYKKNEIALLGLVRAIINHSDASTKDKQAAKALYDEYLNGKITAEQLANGINSLSTVESGHKKEVDNKTTALIKNKNEIKTVNGLINQYTDFVDKAKNKDKEHTQQLKDKNAELKKLTDAQMKYVNELKTDEMRERYIIKSMEVNGISRERAEHLADARQKAGMGFSAKEGSMPEELRKAEAADWSRKKAADARNENNKNSGEYKPTTYNDLIIKSAESFAGGKAHQAVLELAAVIQDKFNITRFTGFNDTYHEGTNSKHAVGLALDFTLKDKKNSAKVSAEIKQLLAANNINAEILDEYKKPSKRATAGHIHVNFASKADADRYLALTKSGDIQRRNTKDIDKRQQVLQVNDLVKQNAKNANYAGLEEKYNLPSGLLSAINMKESDGNNRAIGQDTPYGRAKGGFQLVDATAKRFAVNDPFDNKQAAEGASKYMRFLLDKYKDIDKAIAAYHAGEGNVDKGKGLGPINRKYVKDVKAYMAGVNDIDFGTESAAYDKVLQEQVTKAENAEKEKLALIYEFASEKEKIELDLSEKLKEISENTALNDAEKKRLSIAAKQNAADDIAKIDKKLNDDALKLEYKYADERKKIAMDLKENLREIDENEKLSKEDKARLKIEAEKKAAAELEEFEKEQAKKRNDLLKEQYETELDQLELIKESKIELLNEAVQMAEQLHAVEMANLDVLLAQNQITNEEKLRRERDLNDQLYKIKRAALVEQLDLEEEIERFRTQRAPSGTKLESSKTGSIRGRISALDGAKNVDNTRLPIDLKNAQNLDFDNKFGGMVDRMSRLWDQGINAMMNGTLTWAGATQAIFSEVAAEFIQKMVTDPLKEYALGLARRLAIKWGFITSETAAETAGQAAQGAAVVAGESVKTAATSQGSLKRLAIKVWETIKSIMMSAWEAMAGAWAAMSAIPVIGPVLGVAAGAAAFAGVSALVGKIASARGGYDIPAGINPLTQLHEEEMVLPAQHANTIRALGASVQNGTIGGNAKDSKSINHNTLTVNATDARSFARMLRDNNSELALALGEFYRNGGVIK